MGSKWVARLIIALTLTFLIGPFFIIIFAGLSAGSSLSFPPDGLSLKWYLAVFEVESFRSSFALSMFLAIGGTLSALHAALDDFDPHVFHFTGHGRWDEDLDDGVVLFEGQGARQQPVTGRDLGVHLNRQMMRLVIFNSCDGGRASKVDRFAGIASSLVAQGVPAAIGMQFRFDDHAASIFGSSLLGDLAAGTPIDDALTTARIAVFSIPNDTEWATPVLTSRVAVDEILPRGSDSRVLAQLGSARGRLA